MPDHAFIDTSFFVARFNRRDRHHAAAPAFLREQRESEGEPLRLVLSDYVIDETVMTLLMHSGRQEVAVTAGRAIADSDSVKMIHVELPVFEAGWARFQERRDMRWSFTDCTSFVLMEKLDIRKALTFDRNVREAGFASLP